MTSSISSSPPPYTSAQPSAPTSQSDSDPSPTYTRNPHPTPSITLLLLGSPGTGKSTFVSRLQHVRDGKLQTQPPPSTAPTPPNPATFNVNLFSRPYEIKVHRSTSTLFIDPFPPTVDVLVLCYAVDDRLTLYNARMYWRRVFAEHYEAEVPVMLLGLKRDARTNARSLDPVPEGDVNTRVGSGLEDADDARFVCVMPEEGLNAARDLRADRYAECSALSGELMWEVLEDLTRMAAGTTTSSGGFSQGSGCCVL